MVWLWSFWWFVIFVGLVLLTVLGYAWGYHGWRIGRWSIAARKPLRAGDTTRSDMDASEEAQNKGWLTVVSLCVIIIITLLCFIVGAYRSMWGPYTYPKTNYTDAADVTPGPKS